MHIPQAMKNVFGEDVKLHPVTKRPIEKGSGALPEDQQALHHLAAIEAEEGEAVADKMRKEMGIPTRADREAAAKAAAKEKARMEERTAKALALLDEHEKAAAEKAAAEKSFKSEMH